MEPTSRNANGFMTATEHTGSGNRESVYGSNLVKCEKDPLATRTGAGERPVQN